jgi:hypothetical protein
MKKASILPLVLSGLTLAGAQGALAHGFAGQRFFPATLATDDPFVADEFSFPTISRRTLAAEGDSPAVRETATSIDLAKRITSNFGMEVGATWLDHRSSEITQRGFDNWALGAKYQFHLDERHETIASVGVDWDIGNTGSKTVDAETFSTVTPALFLGKGFGDLPSSLRYLRPLAVTGSVGIGIPSRSSTTIVDEDGDAETERHPHTVNIGLAIEYSLPYLQSFVKDVGLREPFNRIVPLVELNISKPYDRGAGPWTGTVNPGLLWSGRYVQLGLEAVIPVNHATGGGTGVLFQLHFFVDDLFPKSFGKPLI